MDARVPYTLPIKGLKDGMHHFTYEVDVAFFATFPDSTVKEANIQLEVQLDKRPNLMVFDFDFSGTVSTPCDRCLAAINLPIQGQNRLLVKFGEEEEELEDEDVVLIPRETSQWNIAQFVYEYLLLAVPLIKTYDCTAEEPVPCDLDTLDRLEGKGDQQPTEASQDNPIWDALKDWKKD